MRYDISSPNTANDTMALKAEVEPILMRPNSPKRKDVTATAMVGICRRSSIFDNQVVAGNAGGIHC